MPFFKALRAARRGGRDVATPFGPLMRDALPGRTRAMRSTLPGAGPDREKGLAFVPRWLRGKRRKGDGVPLRWRVPG